MLNEDATPLLPDIVYHNLRRKILNGTPKPGQRLRQEELSRELDVSRVPLREAMTRLTSDGLVVLNPRRGYAATSLRSNEILEIFELRAVVEEHAGDRAAYARSKQDVAEVERILIAREAINLGSGNSVESWMQLNYQFHARIIASTGREHLLKFATQLRDTVEPYIRVEMSITGDVEEAQRNHRQLFEAYRDGDAADLAAIEQGARRKDSETAPARFEAAPGLRGAAVPRIESKDGPAAERNMRG